MVLPPWLVYHTEYCLRYNTSRKFIINLLHQVYMIGQVHFIFTQVIFHFFSCNLNIRARRWGNLPWSLGVPTTVAENRKLLIPCSKFILLHRRRSTKNNRKPSLTSFNAGLFRGGLRLFFLMLAAVLLKFIHQTS